MSDRRVLRYEVPVDDRWHRIDHLDRVVYVGARNPAVVEFWATQPVLERRTDTGGAQFISVEYHSATASGRAWEYRAFGTGHLVEGLYVGTAATPHLVWHLFRREVVTDD